ncbi:hypothetical protein [Streptomyces sp. URMC 124]
MSTMPHAVGDARTMLRLRLRRRPGHRHSFLTGHVVGSVIQT